MSARIGRGCSVGLPLCHRGLDEHALLALQPLRALCLDVCGTIRVETCSDGEQTPRSVAQVSNALEQG